MITTLSLPMFRDQWGILVVFLMLLPCINIKAQITDKPSMLEYLSNVVLFNPTFIHIHEAEGKMTHDIMVSGRWNFEVEFKNRKQEAVFSVFDDQHNLLFEIKEEADKAATIIDLSTYGPGLYTIERKVNNKVFVFEVERLM